MDGQDDGSAREGPLRFDSGPAPALVPEGGVFEGQIALLGETRIDGSVSGSLRGSGELVLGARARVEGLVDCDTLDSRGTIVGPVIVRNRARLLAGARVEGDLETPVLAVEEGALWNGRVRVRAVDPARSPGAPAEGLSQEAEDSSTD